MFYSYNYFIQSYNCNYMLSPAVVALTHQTSSHAGFFLSFKYSNQQVTICMQMGQYTCYLEVKASFQYEISMSPCTNLQPRWYSSSTSSALG